MVQKVGKYGFPERFCRMVVIFLLCHLFAMNDALTSEMAFSRPETSRSEGVRDTCSMTIYEVNIRQFTPEGTFNAFARHVPRLKEMGVGILWLMPVHPIGTVQRKGELGSYYAPADHKGINPEFGTESDFRDLVRLAHQHGMLVIIDWVANHTAWDHVWTQTTPEIFTKGLDGGFVPPNPDWKDVIELNYSLPETHEAMTDAMAYWVREFDIDGFRCDVAELVPPKFWASAIPRLRAIKPIFMLAEGEKNWLYDVGFDATYGWGLADTILKIKSGEADARAVREYLERDAAELAEPARYRMYFTTNHDWNSWVGTASSRFAEAWEAATVLTFTVPGLPMIYSGQEAGETRQLAFFDRDPIDWAPHPAGKIYQSLARLKASQRALAHGQRNLAFLEHEAPEQVVAFVRTDPRAPILVLVNLSDSPADTGELKLPGGSGVVSGRWVDPAGQPASVPRRLAPWQAVVLIRS
jgi:glycosidase